jgi:hypothetical protein
MGKQTGIFGIRATRWTDGSIWKRFLRSDNGFQ